MKGKEDITNQEKEDNFKRKKIEMKGKKIRLKGKKIKLKRIPMHFIPISSP